MRFFVFMALAYSLINFGSQVYATPKIPGAECTSYLHMAMMEPLSELSSESATHKYLQYLGYFIEQHYLSVDNLKLLLDFSTAPHLLNLFEAQIPESFIYREDFEKFLPVVELEKVKAFLNVFITAQTREISLKEMALKETVNAIGFHPIIKKFPYEKSMQHEGRFYKDSAEGPLSVDEANKQIWNFNTGRQVPLEWKPSTPGRSADEYSFTSNGETFRVRTTNAFTTTLPTSIVYQIYLNNLNTGKMVFKYEGIGSPQNFKHFTDKSGTLHLAWIEQGRHLAEIKEFLHVADLSNNKVESTRLDFRVNLFKIHWLESEEGELLLYYDANYVKKGFLGLKSLNKIYKKLTVLDASQNGTIVLEHTLAKSDKVLGLAQINTTHYSIYVHSSNPTVEKIIHLRKTSLQDHEWISEEVEVKPAFFPWSADLQTVKTPEGRFYFVSLGGKDGGLQILRIDNLEGKNFGLRHAKKDIIYKPDGGPVIISYYQEFGEFIDFAIIDFENFGQRDIHISDPHVAASNYLGAHFQSDGSLVAYLKSQSFTSFVSGKEFFPLQLYGPFNPKEMK